MEGDGVQYKIVQSGSRRMNGGKRSILCYVTRGRVRTQNRLHSTGTKGA